MPVMSQDEIPCHQAPTVELPCKLVDVAFEERPLPEQVTLLGTPRPRNRRPEASPESPPQERMYYCIVTLLGLKGSSANGTGAELCSFEVSTIRNEPVSNEAVRNDPGGGVVMLEYNCACSIRDAVQCSTFCDSSIHHPTGGSSSGDTGKGGQEIWEIWGASRGGTGKAGEEIWEIRGLRVAYSEMSRRKYHEST